MTDWNLWKFNPGVGDEAEQKELFYEFFDEQVSDSLLENVPSITAALDLIFAKLDLSDKTSVTLLEDSAFDLPENFGKEKFGPS